MKIDVVIPTYCPDKNLIKVIQELENQTIQANKIIIINTEKSKMKMSIQESLLKNTRVMLKHIKKAEFDHGNTRNQGMMLSEADFVLFLTQDVEEIKNDLLENMVAVFENQEIASCYGRQLPRKDCHIIERFTRGFNYPSKSRIKTKDDVKELGIKAYFCSDVCAMYRKSTFIKLGGFPKKTIFNEDMIYAQKVLENNLIIAYVAQATVVHSHNLTPIEQFHRNFDLGVSHAQFPNVFSNLKTSDEGIRLVKSTASYLIRIKKAYLIFYLILLSGAKYIGFQMGKRYRSFPPKMVVACSDMKSYWE